MNSVNIIGFLRENIDEVYRYIEFERPYEEEGSMMEAKIAAKYWTNQGGNRLTELPLHTRVAVHGHLDANKKFGTILLVESLQVIK